MEQMFGELIFCGKEPDDCSRNGDWGGRFLQLIVLSLLKLTENIGVVVAP